MDAQRAAVGCSYSSPARQPHAACSCWMPNCTTSLGPVGPGGSPEHVPEKAAAKGVGKKRCSLLGKEARSSGETLEVHHLLQGRELEVFGVSSLHREPDLLRLSTARLRPPCLGTETAAFPCPPEARSCPEEITSPGVNLTRRKAPHHHWLPSFINSPTNKPGGVFAMRKTTRGEEGRAPCNPCHGLGGYGRRTRAQGGPRLAALLYHPAASCHCSTAINLGRHRDPAPLSAGGRGQSLKGGARAAQLMRAHRRRLASPRSLPRRSPCSASLRAPLLHILLERRSSPSSKRC